MQIIHRANIIHFHKKRTGGGKGDHYALGWRSEESQSRRFAALVKGINLNESSMLDVGCGLADFKTFLNKHFSNVSYTGIDLMPEFINEAARRFANDQFCYFLLGDFFNSQLSAVDYVFSCGALSYGHSDKEYHFEMIQKMWDISRKGIAFSALDKDRFPPHPLLIGFNRSEIIDFCLNFKGKLMIQDHYIHDDFTIQIIRE